MYIEPRGNSLIIRWKFEGTNYHISLKDHNNSICYPLAEARLKQIQSDIRSNNFDTTKAKYCARKAKAAKLESVTASELFDKYSNDRVDNWAYLTAPKLGLEQLIESAQAS